VTEGFGVSQALSAMFGAGAVLVANLIKEKIARHRDEADRANRAILTLARMYGELQNLWDQIYAEAVKEAAAHEKKPPPYMVRPVASITLDSLRLDAGELSFLMRGLDADLPNRLSLVEQSFHQHLLTEQARAERHHEMQKKFEAAGLRNGMQVTYVQAKTVTGDALWAQLTSLTDSQVDGIPETRRRILAVQTQLLNAVRMQFPVRQFVKFKPRDEPNAIWETTPPLAARWRKLMRAAVDKWRDRAKKKRPASEVAT
jgi:hypothetical protein